MDDIMQHKMPLNQALIMQKAQSLFDHLKAQEDKDSTETFVACRGWFEKLKKWTEIHSIRIMGEAASANIKATEEFPEVLKAVVEERGYPPNLIFRVGETGLS